MILQVSNVLPGIPPLSMITVVGLCLMGASMFLYLLSRIPELLLITAISFIYALVPALSIIKHL